MLDHHQEGTLGLLDFFFSLFSKRELPPPRGAIAFLARATSGDQLVAEWPLRTFSVNEQSHEKWDTPIRFLVVDSLGGPAGKSTYRAVRSVVGYLPHKAVAAAEGRIRMRMAAPGMLITGEHYICSFAEGTVGGSAAFGY
jgi:hypothetical protein